MKKLTLDIVIPQLAEKGGMDKIINRFALWLKHKGEMCVRIIQCVDTGLIWWDPKINVTSLYKAEEIPNFMAAAIKYGEYMDDTYQPDVILAAGWPVTITIVAEALKKTKTRRSLIFAWPHMMFAEAEKVGVGNVACLNDADAVFAISGKIETEIKGASISIPTIRINNSIEPPLRRRDKESNQGGLKYNLLYVGRLIDSKNLNLIFRALKETKHSWTLRVVGDGEMQKTIDNCNEYGIQNRVTFDGFREDPWGKMEEADFCIVASDYEGFCLVIPEALARGIPVITTPVGVATEIITNGVNGYLFGINDDKMLVEILDMIGEGKLPVPYPGDCISSAKPYEDDEVFIDYEKKIIDTYQRICDDKQVPFGGKMKTKIYMAAHEKYDPPKMEGYVPIQVGAALHEPLGYLRDDDGENISDKNPYYSELTALYWMWKNDKTSDILGLVHYRRVFLTEGNYILETPKIPGLLEQADVILPEILTFDKGTVESQFLEQHHPEDLHELRKAIEKLYPDYLDDYEKVMSGKTTYCCNMMIAKAELVKDYAAWLFDILFEVEKHLDISSYDTYNKRIFGFLSERLLTLYVWHNHLKIKELIIGATEEKAETREYIAETRRLIEEKKYEEGYGKMLYILEHRPDCFLNNSDIHNTLTYQWYLLKIRHAEEKSGYISGLWESGYDVPQLIEAMKRIQSDVDGDGNIKYSIKHNASAVMIHMICDMLHLDVNREIQVLAAYADAYMAAGDQNKAMDFAKLAMEMGNQTEQAQHKLPELEADIPLNMDMLYEVAAEFGDGEELIISYPKDDAMDPQYATALDYQMLTYSGFEMTSRNDLGTGRISINAIRREPYIQTENAAKYNMVYVLCPARIKSGGEELLHQLVYRILSMGGNAAIAYYNCDDRPDCNPAFVKYVAGHMCHEEDIEDVPGNAVVIPEIGFTYIGKYKNALTMHWWLSVDNFFKAADAFGIKRDAALQQVMEADMHLCQSYYAVDFLHKENVPEEKIKYLSDYINSLYIENALNTETSTVRMNRLLYNPAKGYEFTKKILGALPKDIEAKAIENMTNDEVMQLMKSSKVYIDFGEHPGKDRIPREAALCGLIVITGRRGAAAFSKDVSIPDIYRIDETVAKIEDIVSVIKTSVDEYDLKIRDFDAYRERIMAEEKVFEEDVFRLFLGEP